MLTVDQQSKLISCKHYLTSILWEVPNFALQACIHMRGLTRAQMAEINLQTGGYLGVLDRLAEIKTLGATAVMLAPVTLGGPGLGPAGRAPYSFFAPEPSFATASDPAAAEIELKQLVKGLHEAGLEVIFQVNPRANLSNKLTCLGKSERQDL